MQLSDGISEAVKAAGTRCSDVKASGCCDDTGDAMRRCDGISDAVKAAGMRCSNVIAAVMLWR